VGRKEYGQHYAAVSEGKGGRKGGRRGSELCFPKRNKEESQGGAKKGEKKEPDSDASK